jgi:hypothetical protein
LPPRCLRFKGLRTPCRLTLRPLATGELSAFRFHLPLLRCLVFVFMGTFHSGLMDFEQANIVRPVDQKINPKSSGLS